MTASTTLSKFARMSTTLMLALLPPMVTDTTAAQAIPQPSIDPALVPPDGRPSPDQPMRQSNACAATITVAEPNVSVPAPGYTALNIGKAWEYSTGNGVAVAVIDTGVNPSPRLPAIPGGDYITGGDGLTDCDAHGTIVASIIAAAPQGRPMPAPMPPRPAYPPPNGVSPSTGGPPPPGGQPAPIAPPPPANATEPAPEQLGPAEPQPPVPEVEPPAPEAPSPEDQPAKGPADTNPDAPEDPQVPPPAPGAPDGVVGVAPHATVISIRQSSRAYEPEHPVPGDPEAHRKAGTVATLASAIVHAADIGAKVINISVTSCLSAADPVDQRSIGAAVWYAATVKDAVVVAAAGNEGEDGCAQNPLFDPLNTADPRDWNHVKTVSSPSWFSDYVLSVGAVDNSGAPIDKSLAGPWVAAAAPGVDVMGLSPQTGGPVNAYPPLRPGERNMPFWGTSFSAAFASGVAALVRARYPELSAHQVINRILQTAHHPPRGVDNHVGYGMIDPVAALTFDVAPGDRVATSAQSRVVAPPRGPTPHDHRARNVAVGFAGTIAIGVLLSMLVARVRRSR